MLIKTDYKL